MVSASSLPGFESHLVQEAVLANPDCLSSNGSLEKMPPDNPADPGHRSHSSPKTKVRSFTAFEMNKCSFLLSRICLLNPWSKAGVPSIDSAKCSVSTDPRAGSRTKGRNKALGLSNDLLGDAWGEHDAL